MNNLLEPYVIVGKPVPYKEDSDVISLAEITIGENVVEIALPSSSHRRIAFEIWEHTIHELENLSTALRRSAEDAFPRPFEVPRPESWIGVVVNLTLVAECELGYSLDNPGSDRSRFFVSSRDWGWPDEKLGVSIGVALLGAYGEVVAEPSHALELADWLDSHIERFR